MTLCGPSALNRRRHRDIKDMDTEFEMGWVWKRKETEVVPYGHAMTAHITGMRRIVHMQFMVTRRALNVP